MSISAAPHRKYLSQRVHRSRAAIWIGAALLVVCSSALFLVVGSDELPDRVWAHPGDPWCTTCRAGVPSFTFRLAPDGPSFDPGWCFPEGADGMQLGPPSTAVVELMNSVEAEFRNGEHSYRGGVSYSRTGRTVTIDDHSWTEYQRRRDP